MPVLRWALGLVEIRVWALILAIVAAFLLFNNVPKIQHPPSPSAIECNGKLLAERGTCSIRGEGVLSYDQLVQREQDSARDRAVIWTIFGTGAAAVAVIFVAPIGSRRALVSRRRRSAQPLETLSVGEVMKPFLGLGVDDQTLDTTGRDLLESRKVEIMRVNVDDLTEEWYGTWVVYHYEGEPFTGEMIETAPTGELIKSEMYKDGVPHGPSREWYPNGFLCAAGEYRKGDCIGEWREWHPNGRLAALYLFSEFGNPQSHKLWDEDGKSHL